MADNPKVGEVGKNIIIATLDQDTGEEFDLAGNQGDDGLSVTFIAPDSTTFTRNKTDGVTISATPFVSEEFGTFAANTYFIYPTADGDLFRSGNWKWYGIYQDDTPKKFIGDTVEQTVDEPGTV